MAILLKTTTSARKDIASGKLITKHYDMGDVSINKKFNRCNVTYKMESTGITPLKVSYRLDEAGSFVDFDAVDDNAFSVYDNGARLCRTNGKIKTAEFDFAKNNKYGKVVQIKIAYIASGMSFNSSTDIDGFELSDITFTYRPINRN
tara:strand:+ start:3833 stop:4273 length:441 start_codon:yes stop_codon:yes gene_type:complete